MYNGVYTIEQYAYMHDTLMKWLKNKISGKSLGQRLLEMDISKVAIYGANELGKMVYNDIKESGVLVECFVDKNADKYSSSAEEILNLLKYHYRERELCSDYSRILFL